MPLPTLEVWDHYARLADKRWPFPVFRRGTHQSLQIRKIVRQWNDAKVEGWEPAIDEDPSRMAEVYAANGFLDAYRLDPKLRVRNSYMAFESLLGTNPDGTECSPDLPKVLGLASQFVALLSEYISKKYTKTTVRTAIAEMRHIVQSLATLERRDRKSLQAFGKGQFYREVIVSEGTVRYRGGIHHPEAGPMMSTAMVLGMIQRLVQEDEIDKGSVNHMVKYHGLHSMLVFVNASAMFFCGLHPAYTPLHEL